MDDELMNLAPGGAATPSVESVLSSGSKGFEAASPQGQAPMAHGLGSGMGLESGILGLGNEKTAPATLNPQPATRKLFDNGMSIARRTISDRGRSAGLPSERSSVSTLFNEFYGGAALRGAGDSGQGTTQPPNNQTTQPAMPQVKMFTPTNGGKPFAGYEYNGSRILLGDDIDINDSAAVQKRIAETNDLIDMMNSAYEED